MKSTRNASAALLLLCTAAAVHAQGAAPAAASPAPDAAAVPAPAADVASAPPAAAPAPRGTMTVAYLEGSATAAPRDGAAQPLAQGALLHEGDVVETARGARVEIALATGTTLRIGESSRVELREAPASGAAFRARLVLGNLWARVHKLLGGERFEVETENAVAGVRGTEFRVEAGGEQGADLVRVYEGHVECTGPKGTTWKHMLDPSHELHAAHGKALGGPAAFDPASEAKHPFMRWVRERPVARADDKARPGTKDKVDDRKQDKDDKDEARRKRRGKQ